MVAGSMAPPMEGIPNHWHVYFAVEDMEASLDKARQLGAKVINGPMPTPIGPMATMSDPQGAVFSLFQAATPGRLTGRRRPRTQPATAAATSPSRRRSPWSPPSKKHVGDRSRDGGGRGLELVGGGELVTGPRDEQAGHLERPEVLDA